MVSGHSSPELLQCAGLRSGSWQGVPVYSCSWEEGVPVDVIADPFLEECLGAPYGLSLFCR